MTIAKNKLNQSKDIAGSRLQNSALDISEEPLMLGAPISGQSGASASILGAAPDIIITGLTGITEASSCRFLTLSGAASAGNNGTFQITEVVGPGSVVINNPAGITGDLNNGSINWVERGSYSLEDDLNYIRSDRENIKGVDYYGSIPQYTRCSNQIAPIDANLANISGNTTDAKSAIYSVKLNLNIGSSDTFITATSVGNLKHADVANVVGVPIYDGYDSGNDEATFTVILDDAYAVELTVLNTQAGGAEAGWRIFGRTRAGASVSPDSVEIELRAAPPGKINLSTPYTWEAGQPNVIDVLIPYRDCLRNVPETSPRDVFLHGFVYGEGGGGVPIAAQTVGQVLFSINGSTFTPSLPITSNQGWLVNDQGILVVYVNE
jgi:hypothetical protein